MENRWGERLKALGPWLLLTGILGLYLGDVLLWASRSDVWLHTDGHIHFERSLQTYKLFTEPQPGQDTWRNLTAISGYGPFLYLLTLPLIHLLGPSYLTTVFAQGLFGVAGGVGAFLLGRRLGGVWAGLFSAAILVALPMYRIHTCDVMLDFAGTGISMLALGLFAQSDFMRRPWVTALGALSIAIALMTRWPHVLGIGPLLWWFITVSTWKQRQSIKEMLGVALILAALGGAAGALYMWAPESLFEGQAPLMILGLSLMPAALSAYLWWAKKPVFWRNLLNMIAILGVVMGPYYVFARTAILGAIGVQVGMADIVDAYSTPLYAGVLGKVLVVLNIAYKWEWGPYLFPWVLAGILYFSVAKQSRWIASLPIIFGLTLDAGIIIIKPPVVERWLFPSAMAVLPLGVSLPFALGRKWLLPPFLAVAALVFYNAYAWHIPEAPGRISAKPWRADVKVYNEPCCAFGNRGYADHDTPWMTFKPYKTEYDWSLPEAFLETHSQTEILMGVMVDEDAREAFMPVRSIGNFERFLQQRNEPFYLEDVLDRVGFDWHDYDAWILVQHDNSDLIPKVGALFSQELKLYVAPISTFQDLQIYLFWRAEGPLKTDLQGRLKGKDLMTPGYGYSNGNRLRTLLFY